MVRALHKLARLDRQRLLCKRERGFVIISVKKIGAGLASLAIAFSAHTSTIAAAQASPETPWAALAVNSSNTKLCGTQENYSTEKEAVDYVLNDCGQGVEYYTTNSKYDLLVAGQHKDTNKIAIVKANSHDVLTRLEKKLNAPDSMIRLIYVKEGG